MTKLKNKRVGSHVQFLYPLHGKMNILCNVDGVIEKKGKGPNGPYKTVRNYDGKIRSYSDSKIVEQL